MRFQVRKREGEWQVWIFLGRSWRLLESFHSFNWAMAMATGQAAYGPDVLVRQLSVQWVRS